MLEGRTGRLLGERARKEVESEGDEGVLLVLREVLCCAKRGEEKEEEEEEEEVAWWLAFRCGAQSREEMIGGMVLVIRRVKGARCVAELKITLVLTGIR